MMEIRVELMEEVIAPGVWQVVCDFCRGFVDGFLA